jgi:hypothetical protein
LSDPAHRNLVPGKYRGVAVAHVDGPLDQRWLARHFLGREAYRRTRFVVARNANGTAIVRVRKQSDEPLFAPIVEVEMLAGADECAYVVCPDVDTGVPSALARAAISAAPGMPGGGRAGPLRTRQLHRRSGAAAGDGSRGRAAATGEAARPGTASAGCDRDLAADAIGGGRGSPGRPGRAVPSDRYLVPCRGSGFGPPGAQTAYLDERPSQEPWALVGCERSQQIHEWFYGERADQVDICPRARTAIAGPLLTKCCLFEHGIVVDEGQVTVPGAPLLPRSPRRWWPSPSRGSRRGRPPDRLAAVRPPVRYAGVCEHLRRTGQAAELVGHPQRAGGRAGQARHHPG